MIDMAISEYESGSRKVETIFDLRRHNFLVNARTNHHFSGHALVSCFKKGPECRFHKPELWCKETVVKFEEEVTDWHKWNGAVVHRNLFEVRLKRSPFDVHMNNCNPMVFNCFKCISNVAVGLDRPAIMCCTGCAGKAARSAQRM